MPCNNCNQGFIRMGEDQWKACECLLDSRYAGMKLGPDKRNETAKIPAGDFIIEGKVDKTQEVANQVIWTALRQRSEVDCAYAFSGDISGQYLSGSSGEESFLRGFEEADILFIYLVTGEAHGKLTGTVVNSVYEFRKALGLRTVFIVPYGGIRLWKRYPAEESDFSLLLKSLEVVSV